MDILEFNEAEKYVPYLGHVPVIWHDCSFSKVDFTDREDLKALVEQYLENFEIEGSDSLVVYPSEFAYSLAVSIYIEISKRLSVDNYLFMDWNDFVAKIQGLYNKGEHYLTDQLFGKRFVFLFDVTLADKFRMKTFLQILDYCYLNKIKMIAATRLDGITIRDTLIPDEFKMMYRTKVVTLEIKNDKRL